jgi:predicted amidophosphoribosyltransferase
VIPALERDVAVPRSSSASRGERPGVSRHFASLAAEAIVDVGRDIVIVDDVVTKGSTAIAVAPRLAEDYPQADIKLFALVRTKGFVPEIDRIVDPTTGTIRLVYDEGDRQP